MFLKTIKGLEGLHFSKKDAEMIERLGMTPEQVSTKSIVDIFDAIKHWQEYNQKEFESVRKEGKDARVDPNRTADLEKAKSPKKIRNRISLISRLFKNADHKFKSQHELDAIDKELIGELTPEEVKKLEEEGEKEAS